MDFDFKALKEQGIRLGEFAETVTLAQLRAETEKSVAWLVRFMADVTDADVVFDPDDPEANDPFAVEGEEGIGWTIGHLVAHVTASSEEGAAFCSLLGRGVPVEGRLRYETDWKEIDTKEKCLQRIAESRKIRIGYLDALPEEINFELIRPISPGFEKRVGKLNAFGNMLLGLSHEHGHREQMEAVKAQAKAS